MRNLGNTRILVIDCPKELVDRKPPTFQGCSISVVRIEPDSMKCCLDSTSIMNFTNYIRERILDEDHGDLVVYLVHFRNKTALQNFHDYINYIYPKNIIEFLENPYFQDIHDVVSSYLYTLKEDPESYGYRIGDINRLINEWTYFCNIDELYPKVSTLGYNSSILQKYTHSLINRLTSPILYPYDSGSSFRVYR